MWVSPFGYLRIIGYLLLPEAFRSLSRPSSALSAKASTLRSYCLTFLQSAATIALVTGFCVLLSIRFISEPEVFQLPRFDNISHSRVRCLGCLFPISYVLRLI